MTTETAGMRFSYTKVGEVIYETATCPDCDWTVGPFDMLGEVNTVDLTEEHERLTGHPAAPGDITLTAAPTDPDDEDDPFILDAFPPEQIAALRHLLFNI